MKVTIKGMPEEIAALVLAVQERQARMQVDEVAKTLAHGVSKNLLKTE